MKRFTIVVDDALLRKVNALALEQQRSAGDIIREALVRRVEQHKKKGKTLSYIGVGASGKTNIAEQHEQLLARISCH